MCAFIIQIIFVSVIYRVIQDIDDVPRENNNYKKSCSEVKIVNEF
jgi:hypothetical protein